MDLIRLAYYPFLPEAREAARELGPDVASLLAAPTYHAVRRRGRGRVEGAMGSGIAPAAVVDDRSALQEILSVPVARMLVTVLADAWIASRYAAAEAARVAEALRKDADLAALPEAAAALGVPVVPVADGAEGAAWRIHVADYLRLCPEREAAWKLVLRTVHKGAVHLTRDDAIVLCREALAQRIEADLAAERERGVPADLRAALAAHLDALAPLVAESKAKVEQGDFGPVRRELFPPCITDLFGQMKAAVNVPHHGRFAVASFLSTIGMDAEQILAFYREIPNFDADKSRYQIEHIAGERGVSGYTPPGCAWMQTNAICPLEKRDGLCFKIKHPLSYYRARLRFQRAHDGAAAGAPTPTEAPDAAAQAPAAPTATGAPEAAGVPDAEARPDAGPPGQRARSPHDAVATPAPPPQEHP